MSTFERLRVTELSIVPNPAGESVTQATSITTAVTLNSNHGHVVTVSSTLAAGGNATFQVNNNRIKSSTHVDVHVSAYSDSATGTPVANCTRTADGSFKVTLQNIHATAALNAAVTISFVATHQR